MTICELLHNVSALSAIIFIAGILLIIIEMFYPGFGAFGILGIICLVIDIFVTAKSVAQGLVMTAIIALIVVILLIISSVAVSHGKLPKKLKLRESLRKDEGFSGGADLSGYMGKNGTALTELRPAGTAMIDGKRVDVVSNGEFIEPGTGITVIETGGNRIVVKAEEDRGKK